jgi:hypothetical protein
MKMNWSCFRWRATVSAVTRVTRVWME